MSPPMPKPRRRPRQTRRAENAAAETKLQAVRDQAAGDAAAAKAQADAAQARVTSDAALATAQAEAEQARLAEQQAETDRAKGRVSIRLGYFTDQLHR